MSSSVFLAGNISAALLVFPLSSKYGLRNLMLLSTLLVIMGCFARIGINLLFEFILLGQFLVGMAACFVVNIQMQFCYNWFHPKSRGLFISVTGVLNLFGGGLGALIPLLFVDNENTDAVLTQKEVSLFMYVQLGASLLIGLLVFIVFTEKPSTGFGFNKKLH